MLKATMVAWSKQPIPEALGGLCRSYFSLSTCLFVVQDKGLREKLKLYSNCTVKQTKTNKQTINK